METIRQYRILEMSFPTRERVCGTFWIEGTDKKTEIEGFLRGADETGLRFLPDTVGTWNYRVCAKEQVLAEGSFCCAEPEPDNHGMVRADGCAFCYADGTRYLPFGTTCYAWIHQTEELRKQTLESLSRHCFNKVRMLVFPKDMIYNQNEPELFPFEKTADGWAADRPVFAFWERLEEAIAALDALGIEADLILFHPYDRWGFAGLSREQSVAYVTYAINRLAAHKNVWWSLANEYDLVGSKEQEDWDELGALIAARDPYGHLRSIHHCLNIYPKREWMTHVSAQTQQVEKALEYRMAYKLPVLIDECGYEGNIAFAWGNLSAPALVHHVWTTVIRGGYATHGETFYNEDEVLWWSKGGILRGESPARIAFLRELLESLGETLEPACDFAASDPNGRREAEESPFAKAMMRLPERQRNEQIMLLLPPVLYGRKHVLQYLGRACQAWLDMQLPEGDYRIEVIDTWEMTRRTVCACAQKNVHIPLPGREQMAVLATRV